MPNGARGFLVHPFLARDVLGFIGRIHAPERLVALWEPSEPRDTGSMSFDMLHHLVATAERLVQPDRLRLHERRFRMHTQPLPAECITENDEDSMSGLFKKFDSLKVTFSESDFSGRHSWIETVYDCELFSKLSALSSEDVELLTLYVFDEYTQSEIATKIGISQRGVGKRIERIGRFLK